MACGCQPLSNTESLLTSYSAWDAWTWIKLNIEPGYAHYDGKCPGQNGVCTSSNLPCKSATKAAGGIQVRSALGRCHVQHERSRCGSVRLLGVRSGGYRGDTCTQCDQGYALTSAAGVPVVCEAAENATDTVCRCVEGDCADDSLDLAGGSYANCTDYCQQEMSSEECAEASSPAPTPTVPDAEEPSPSPPRAGPTPSPPGDEPSALWPTRGELVAQSNACTDAGLSALPSGSKTWDTATEGERRAVQRQCEAEAKLAFEAAGGRDFEAASRAAAEKGLLDTAKVRAVTDPRGRAMTNTCGLGAQRCWPT